MLFFSNSLLAYSDEELGREIKILIDRIQDKHVKPRPVDESFAAAVNSNFLEYLDGNKLIFTKEDEKDFESKQSVLLNDLKQGTTIYFQFVRDRYQAKLDAFSEKGTQFYASAVPNMFTAKINGKLNKDRPEAAQQQLFWNRYFSLRYYEEMIDRLSDSETAFPKDSVAAWSILTRTYLSKRMNDYSNQWKEGDQLGNLFLNAIALSFDPHTNFFTNQVKNNFEEELTSEREIYGLNIQFDLNNKTIVSAIAPGSPAWLSNEIHVDDEVLSITFKGGKTIEFDGTLERFNEATKTFDVSEASEIDLKLRTNDNSGKTVHLVKSKVYSDQDIIKNALLEGEKRIGYVALPDFYVNWTDTSSLGCANDLAKCLIKLKRDSIQGLILDLRGNGGGSLREAIDVSGIFIDFGPVLAVKSKEDVQVLKDINRGSIYTGPLMIMIDEGSASASEIVAGTLQDYNRAVIFGTPSFGKATAQSIFALDPKINDLSMGMLHEDASLGYANITLGQLYRITGKWNQLLGVQPDVLWPLKMNDSNSEQERDYQNVLIPDSISKKINFTPAKKLNLELFRSSSSDRLKSDSAFVAYSALIAEFNRLAEAETPTDLSLDNLLIRRNTWMNLIGKLETFEKQLICNFTPSTNHFDRDLIASDEILGMYNRQFLESLQKDVELMEGVNVMMDIIKNQ